MDPATYIGVCRDLSGCVRRWEADAKAVWDWDSGGQWYVISYPPSSILLYLSVYGLIYRHYLRAESSKALISKRQ